METTSAIKEARSKSAFIDHALLSPYLLQMKHPCRFHCFLCSPGIKQLNFFGVFPNRFLCFRNFNPTVMDSSTDASTERVNV